MVLMFFDSKDYREVLQKEYQRRLSANAQYSLRAFARNLSMPASSLNEIINKKSGISLKRAIEICRKLDYNALESEYFSILVEVEHGRAKRDREIAKVRLKKFLQRAEKKLTLDVFNYISEWYHVGVLELSRINGFQSDYKWISRKLNISAKEVRLACERLIRLGILKREKGNLEAAGDWILKTPAEIPSDSIKQFHKTILNKASIALYEQSLDLRNFNSMIMSIDPDKIAEAKKLIAELNERLLLLMTNTGHQKRLYCFSSQLFQIDRELE